MCLESCLWLGVLVSVAAQIATLNLEPQQIHIAAFSHVPSTASLTLRTTAAAALHSLTLMAGVMGA